VPRPRAWNKGCYGFFDQFAAGPAHCDGKLYVDTRSCALAEAGEIIQAIQAGVIVASNVKGEMSDLTTGEVAGRASDESITLFKSVGTAIEDLAVADLAMLNYSKR